MTDSEVASALRAENARLVALLEASGIDWKQRPASIQPPHAAAVALTPARARLPTEDKIALFRELFRGRTDAYPVRWESKAGKTGYSPACANEWRAGVCEKPRIKCADCGNRSLVPLAEQTVYDHLTGRHTIGVYPLLTDDSLPFPRGRFRRRGLAQRCPGLHPVLP